MPKKRPPWMHALAIEDGVEIIRAAEIDATRAASTTLINSSDHRLLHGWDFAFQSACGFRNPGKPPRLSTAIFLMSVFWRNLKAPTLFIAGKRDAWINEAKVSGLKEIAEKYALPVEVLSYDADHAFFNDTRPAVYDAEAAKDAWQKVQEHFKRHLA